MKKDYTLKLVLAMLVVVLVSLVSFVGVYRGRNLLKEYSLGKDFSKRKIATFSVVEDKNENQQSEESAENQEGNQEQKQPLSEKDIIKVKHSIIVFFKSNELFFSINTSYSIQLYY